MLRYTRPRSLHSACRWTKWRVARRRSGLWCRLLQEGVGPPSAVEGAAEAASGTEGSEDGTEDSVEGGFEGGDIKGVIL